MVASDNASIVLQRSSGWTYRFTGLVVLVDGKKRGTIANGKSQTFTVAPGKHEVQVKGGWPYKSAPLELNLAAGTEVLLECGVPSGTLESFTGILEPSSYIYLRDTDSSRHPEQNREDSVEKLAPHSESLPVNAHVFVSYRREDSPDVCGRIYDRLVQKFGKAAVFKDVDSIPFGVDFREHLDDKVSQCSVLLAVIGDRWLEVKNEEGKCRLFDARDYVRIEIESALKRNIPVIPLLVRGARLPDVGAIPESISSLVYRNGLPVRPDPDFHNDMDRLLESLCNTLDHASKA